MKLEEREKKLKKLKLLHLLKNKKIFVREKTRVEKDYLIDKKKQRKNVRNKKELRLKLSQKNKEIETKS